MKQVRQQIFLEPLTRAEERVDDRVESYVVYMVNRMVQAPPEMVNNLVDDQIESEALAIKGGLLLPTRFWVT